MSVDNSVVRGICARCPSPSVDCRFPWCLDAIFDETRALRAEVERLRAYLEKSEIKVSTWRIHYDESNAENNKILDAIRLVLGLPSVHTTLERDDEWPEDAQWHIEALHEAVRGYLETIRDERAEVERLRMDARSNERRLANYVDDLHAREQDKAALRAEVERLRAAVRKIASLADKRSSAGCLVVMYGNPCGKCAACIARAALAEVDRG